MRILVEFDREKLDGMNYPVFVERFKKVLNTGSGKRKFMDEFPVEADRRKIGDYYRTFYDWHLRRGTPESHAMTVNTYFLLCKAIAFFAGM